MKALTTHWSLSHLQTEKENTLFHLINFTDRTWKLSQTITRRMSHTVVWTAATSTARIIGLSHSSSVTPRD